MIEPKWQKALLKNDDTVYPTLRGKEVWLKIGPPKMRSGVNWGSDTINVTMGYQINIIAPNGNLGLISVDAVSDLLGCFAENVPLIDHSDVENGHYQITEIFAHGRIDNVAR